MMPLECVLTLKVLYIDVNVPDGLYQIMQESPRWFNKAASTYDQVMINTNYQPKLIGILINFGS